MALVIAHADAKQLRAADRSNNIGEKFSYFSFPDELRMPHASFNGHVGHRIGKPHFHIRDQFQLAVDGDFKIGRHKITPYSIHFARAYTPYGPLVPEGDYTFVVMRARRDLGPHYLAEKADMLKSMPNRKPWQVTARAEFPPQTQRDSSADAILTPVPEVKDDRGLAAYTLVLKPNSKAYAPDPSSGDGQYVVVVKGSLWHDNKEHKPLTLVFVQREEGAYQLHAGAEGLEAVVLNFPEVEQAVEHVAKPAAKPGYKVWQCALCAFVYDEKSGMPEEGIAPGTRWADVPESWSCPDCSAMKSDFEMVEVTV